MKSSFNEMNLLPDILKAIGEMGFETPTEVQSDAIPHILNKEDLIVMSKTGSGKTAVFGVSMLQLIDKNAPGPQGLILTPTRELAVQVDSDIKKMSKYTHHKSTAVYGQHSMNMEIQAINNGISIVTGTPGRLFDHIRQGNLQTKYISYLVIDEADRMLDMGFLDQVVRIIKSLPKDRVTLLFSATMPNEIRRICMEYMNQPLSIEIESQTKTVDTTKQLYYRVQHNEKNLQLNRLLLIEQPQSCIIFCNTKNGVDRVQTFLTRKGYACQSLHGDIPQGKRLKTIQQFTNGDFHILIATDVAARGIHVNDLSLVINYDVPMEKDSYVHRIGRTGRAGHDGRAISLVTGDDIMTIYEIEEHSGAMIPEAELPSEEEFNEKSANAKEWIQANKITTPYAAVNRNDRASQTRTPPQRVPQPRTAPQSKSEQKTAQPRIAQQSKSQPRTSQPKALQPKVPQQSTSMPRMQQSTSQTGTQQSRTQQTRVPRSQDKPWTRPTSTNVEPRAPRMDSAAKPTRPPYSTSIPKPSNVANTSKSAKVPFLKRVLQRLLGK